MLGKQVGEWLVEEELGKGSWGTVYRVRHQQSNRVMALKLLRDPSARNPTFHLRFQAEMAVLRRLDHPHIVKYYDHGLHDDYPYYVMEFVEGPSFQRRVADKQRVPWEEVLRYSIQTVAALLYAHRRGILHRSLKPSNVLEFGPGQVKVSDFGVLKLFAETVVSPSVSPVLEPVYCSPEQLSGKSLTKRSDFYSFGTLLYSLLVGRPPFAGSNFVEIVQKVCFTLPERPIHYLPDLPEEIDALIAKLLAKEPAQRPGSGTLLLREFERIWSDLERKQRLGKRPEMPPTGSDSEIIVEPEIDGDPYEYVVTPTRERRWLNGVFLFVALLIVVAILIWAFFFRGESAEAMMAHARPLLESEHYQDWERAWDEYVGKVAKQYPNDFVAEVKDARFRIERIRELRGTLLAGKPRPYQSEAERFYDEGYRLARAGEIRPARQRWRLLIAVYRDEEAEQKWVFAARLGLEMVVDKKADERSELADAQRIRQELRREVDRFRTLRRDGHASEAEELRRSLESLYQGNAVFEEYRAELNPN